NGDLNSMLRVLMADPKATLRGLAEAGRQRSFGRRTVQPKSVNQRRYLEAIEKYDMVFGIGPAGTGKTYLAVAMAISALLAKRVNRIILARPAVEAGERLGFLPGTLQEKIDPYLRPLYDALYDMLDPEKVDRYLEKNVIEIAPIAFMRGRTLNDSFVILDEAQNESGGGADGTSGRESSREFELDGFRPAGQGRIEQRIGIGFSRGEGALRPSFCFYVNCFARLKDAANYYREATCSRHE